MSVECTELRRIGVDEARRRFDDAGLAVSSVISIGPALPCRRAPARSTPTSRCSTPPPRCGAPGVLASTGPLGDLPSRDADVRCRAWLERARAPRRRSRCRSDARTHVSDLQRPLVRAHVGAHARTGRRSRRCDRRGRHRASLVGPAPRRALRRARRRHRHRAAHQRLEVERSTSSATRARRSPTGAVPLRELVEAFDAAGYRGWYEHEVLTDETGGPRAVRPRRAGVVRRDLE